MTDRILTTMFQNKWHYVMRLTTKFCLYLQLTPNTVSDNLDDLLITTSCEFSLKTSDKKMR